MTLMITENGVEHTPSTEMSIGGHVDITGNLNNSGSVSVFERGRLKVSKDVNNTGKITINDPERFKQIATEAVKTVGKVADSVATIFKKLT